MKRAAALAALAALARAIDAGGDVDVAYAALSGVDPLVRRRARLLVRDAYVDGMLATQIKKGELAAPHALRLAYLAIAGARPDAGAIDDVEAVEAAFTAARAGRREAPRFWWVTAAALLALALGGAGASIAIARELAPRRHPSASDWLPPPSRGAFESGGRPMPGEPAVRRAFQKDIPSLLIQLDRWGREKRGGAAADRLATLEKAMDEASARALGPDVRGGLGEAAARRLGDLLAAARAAVAAPEPEAQAAGDALLVATGRLDDELAAAGLGYFVDGDVITGSEGRRSVILYAFTVERVSLFEAGGASVRALDLRRLDSLNLVHAALGFSRPHLRDAIVLLDQLEGLVLDVIAPGLGGAKIALFDEGGAQPAARAAVEERAGEIVRAEYGALPGVDVAAARRLGEILGRRRKLFEAWNERAARRGALIATPEKLLLGDEYEEALRGVVPSFELAELRKMNGELEAPEISGAYAALREALVASVQRHEVQHRLDFSRGAPLRMPRSLEERVGAAETGGRENRHAARARNELSAYLGELARDPRTARSNFTMTIRHLFDRKMHGTAESYAALAILEGLAADLAPGQSVEFVKDHRVDLDAVCAAYLAVSRASAADLRAAAGRLWQKLFGDPLPALRRTAPAEGG